VPVGGATTPPSQRTIFTTPERVTTLNTVLDFIYWGDNSGVIGVVRADGSSVETIATTGGLIPTSISTSVRGGVYAQAWTQCGSQSCQLHFDVPSGGGFVIRHRRRRNRRVRGGVRERFLGRCRWRASAYPALSAIFKSSAGRRGSGTCLFDGVRLSGLASKALRLCHLACKVTLIHSVSLEPVGGAEKGRAAYG
jgi:hypothetical protein